jgi:IS5 family transposase
LAGFNQRLTELATQVKVTHGRKIRTDGTVVETLMHAPSDSSLSAGNVQVLGRTLQRAKGGLGDATELAEEVFRNRIRSACRLASQVGEAIRHTSDAAKVEGQGAYRHLVQISRQTLVQAEQILPLFKALTTSPAERLTPHPRNIPPESDPGD